MVLFAMIGYVLAQFAVGIWVSRRVKSESDYILAGRSLGPTLVAFSVFATWFGAEAIVATTAEVYDKGISGALVDPLAYGLAVVAAGFLYAAVLWRKGVTTFADVFRERFSPSVEKLVVIILLPGSVFWAAAQIRAFGQVLSSSSDMSLSNAIILAAVLVASYSVIGGLLAEFRHRLSAGHRGHHRARCADDCRHRGLGWRGTCPTRHAGRSPGARHAGARHNPGADRGGRRGVLRLVRRHRADLALPRRPVGRGRPRRHGHGRRHVHRHRHAAGLPRPRRFRPRANQPGAESKANRTPSRPSPSYRSSTCPNGTT